MTAKELAERLREAARKKDPEARVQYLLGLHRYEREKRFWRASNPASTPREYEAAIKLIAEECGV